jgi:hypothetical protein
MYWTLTAFQIQSFIFIHLMQFRRFLVCSSFVLPQRKSFILYSCFILCCRCLNGAWEWRSTSSTCRARGHWLRLLAPPVHSAENNSHLISHALHSSSRCVGYSTDSSSVHAAFQMKHLKTWCHLAFVSLVHLLPFGAAVCETFVWADEKCTVNEFNILDLPCTRALNTFMGSFYSDHTGFYHPIHSRSGFILHASCLISKCFFTESHLTEL